jgi:hypothetical protein
LMTMGMLKSGLSGVSTSARDICPRPNARLET